MQMRALGRGSLSSVLKVLTDLAWVVSCAALAFIWLITGLSALAMVFPAEALTRISIQDQQQLINWTVFGSIICLGVMAIASYLRGIFKTLVVGDPFVPENATRLRRIAYILAALELVRMLAQHFMENEKVISSKVSDAETGVVISLNFNLIAIGAILVLIVLAQVFDEGARLREDQKMTI